MLPVIIILLAIVLVPVLWFIGAVTSLLTAIYMFRLVFLAFHGERRPSTALGVNILC